MGVEGSSLSAKQAPCNPPNSRFRGSCRPGAPFNVHKVNIAQMPLSQDQNDGSPFGFPSKPTKRGGFPKKTHLYGYPFKSLEGGSGSRLPFELTWLRSKSGASLVAVVVSVWIE